ncbi:FAD-dependent oxidoreductase [Pokkaliibacter plantistimulans]|uniref:FAD-dependent oxidoreductase n=1 Tax=Pokkaliibacter plantistimulans TaxID=1635171 RepID=A0ABX5M094_9GAMM|nr:NAD(P)/FAD-dependent oxidoreductase [Pokkaliibacter plantistimulans]PXF30981.1 FAD-dependent oxidoreductase [Pokkaliibacter plantistimulans]
MKTTNGIVDALVIGAGPAGVLVSTLLHRLGHRVQVVEQNHFPRFSIGESLLPQCMAFLAQADMLAAVSRQGYQFKNGAAFAKTGEYEAFDFTDKFSDGPGTTFQVPRAPFDQVLAQEAQRQGVLIRFGQRVESISRDQGISQVQVTDKDGNVDTIAARFVLDASGFGRVLPRLLGLEVPSDFPARKSVMTHIEDGIDDPAYDRHKILITVHPQHADVWFWLIPFSNGRCSVGVVGEVEFFKGYHCDDEQLLRQLIGEAGSLATLLRHARFDTPCRSHTGYAANVSRLFGEGFALLGNAGEFLDPVFSSGVTIAMKSATLAAEALDRQLRGEDVDWQAVYADPLKQGVDTFREFVTAWYDGRLQHVIFSRNKNPEIRRMISAVLAGYAWDESNPYVKEPGRLSTLAELCREHP